MEHYREADDDDAEITFNYFHGTIITKNHFIIF
jgi:hypothetical protein